MAANTTQTRRFHFTDDERTLIQTLANAQINAILEGAIDPVNAIHKARLFDDLMALRALSAKLSDRARNSDDEDAPEEAVKVGGTTVE